MQNKMKIIFAILHKNGFGVIKQLTNIYVSVILRKRKHFLFLENKKNFQKKERRERRTLMKKKIVSALLCVAMLSTMLVGCGGSGGKSSKADGDKPYSGEKLTVLYMSGRSEEHTSELQSH